MSLLQPGKAPLHMPTQAQEVYDVTGAGDTVIGVLAATLAAGNSLEEACFFANAAAGVVVGKLGHPRFRRSSWKTQYVDVQIPALA
ncbi:bifunctional protein HldE [includes: D-beta-D-heptose 7-phosphate kinase; D-beta-D-heptose 1-phosphate adenosyltransferase] [Escherichia coli]|uniref:Bifunctional protein HldE [includes: D-beta-D-heptose 7-phosphate kinase D-beta-D-heptose 1-phosphate adenosyltransferase] n=1 Tax=Escherichia coli TaxID=562 RepID=A0A376LBG0_ECOLX|nr:bifunctional protein HldE [includes: D-beta-D-heptose 7-phosphate kinase; D-beta-D-heptose 1-phosphate adenosyltransferase] [Escherichia coli]